MAKSEVLLSRSSEWSSWYEKFVSRAQTAKVFKYIDIDQDGPILEEPTEPITEDELLGQFNEAALGTWERERQQDAEGAGPRPEPVTELPQGQVNRHARKWNEYKAKMAAFATYQRAYADLAVWIQSTVDEHQLANTTSKSDIRMIVRDLKSSLAPSLSEEKELARLKYRQVLTQTKRVKPEDWLLAWNKAKLDGDKYKIPELEGESGINDFLTACSAFDATWANQQWGQIEHSQRYNIKMDEVTLRSLSELFSRQIRRNRSNKLNDSVFAMSDTAAQNSHCPCGLPSSRHRWKAVDCAAVRIVVNGESKDGRQVNPRRIKACEEALKQAKWKSLVDKVKDISSNESGDSSKPTGNGNTNKPAAFVGLTFNAEDLNKGDSVFTTLRDKHPLYNSTILDGGATTHLVNNKDLLIGIREAEETDYVMIGEGSLKVQARGTRIMENILDSENGENTRDLQLINVAYVPRFHTNIISSDKLEEKGLWLHGFDNTLRIGTLSSNLKGFLTLPPEIEDAIWEYYCPVLVDRRGLCRIFIVDEMLTNPDTHAIYATTFLHHSTSDVRNMSRISRRTYALVQRRFPDVLQFYYRTHSCINGQWHVADEEGSIRFHKQMDILFLHEFAPLRNSRGEIDLVSYELGNFASQAKNVALRQSVFHKADRRCEALLTHFTALKTIYCGFRTRSNSQQFREDCYEMRLASNNAHFVCVGSNLRFDGLCIYCWPDPMALIEPTNYEPGIDRLHKIAHIRRWELARMILLESDDVRDFSCFDVLENFGFEEVQEAQCWEPWSLQGHLPSPEEASSLAYSSLGWSLSSLSVSHAAYTASPIASIASPTLSIASPTLSIASPTLSIASPTLSIASPTLSIASPTLSIASPTPSIASPTPSIISPTSSIVSPTEERGALPPEFMVELRDRFRIGQTLTSRQREQLAGELSEYNQPNIPDRKARRVYWLDILETVERQLLRELQEEEERVREAEQSRQGRREERRRLREEEERQLEALYQQIDRLIAH